ncbi:MAG: FliH/SctL family protein [Tissierellia bacterium]|nr:FliH/SctL family protein [Tissierellia bacterium]
MSSIIKSEYVVFNKKSKIKDHQQQASNVVNSPMADLYDIYNQREVILEEANEEAKKIINAAKMNAQIEIDECKRRGYEEGYNEGIEKGISNGYVEGYENGKSYALKIINEQNSNKVKEIAEMIEEIEDEKQKILAKYEAGLTELSIGIAEKIIRKKIDSDDNVALRIIDDVIKDYRNIEWIKLYISSNDDLITIQADKNLVNELNKISKDVKIEILDKLDAGSVIIETPDGIIDGSVETQLKNLKEMVLNKNAS